MPHIWVAQLKISQATAEKINGLHGISGQEVKDAVECVRGLPFVWDDDPVRGRRAIVQVNIRGPVEIALYPKETDAYGDVWALGSAYPH
ncbi:MAG: hypothetical protein ACLQPH_18730 [Acidimicrobiales bacterium]